MDIRWGRVFKGKDVANTVFMSQKKNFDSSQDVGAHYILKFHRPLNC